MLAAGGKAPVSGGLESAGSTADLLSGFGTTFASTGISGEGMFSTGTAAEKQQAEAASKRLRESDAFDTSAGNVLRRRADEFAPDPETSHKADQVVHGVVRGVSKAVADIAVAGPVVGPALFGLDEGNTTAQRLRVQGVDTETAAKVGGVTGLISGVTAGIPAVGPTIKATIGLGLATGPAAFMAQEKLTHDILQKADYGDLASQHDPLDPLGLTLSTILPLAVGGVHIRGMAKRAEAVKGGGVPLEQMTPQERQGLKFNDQRLDTYAEQAAVNNGVPPSILLGIKNAGEKSNSNQVSPKGAAGVMQFMESTAKEVGIKDRTDPVQSIDGAARYLKQLYDAYGSWDAAVAHYNGGGAQAAIVRGGGKPTFPETAAYLERVKKYAAEHASERGAADPQVVDAARVAVTDEALMRSMPERPSAREEVMRATDEVAAGRIPEVAPPPAESGILSHGPADTNPTGGAFRSTNDAGQELHSTVAGESASPGWAGATGISREGVPVTLFRGAAQPLDASHFDLGSLGYASKNPSSGLGVWLTHNEAEAARYGDTEAFHADVRKPKIIKADELPAFDSVADAHKFREKLRSQGYDGIVLTARHLGGEVHVVAFDPHQVIHPRPVAAEATPLSDADAAHFGFRPADREASNALPDTRSATIEPEPLPKAAESSAPSLDSQRVKQIADENMKVRLPGSDETMTVEAALKQAKEEAAYEASEADLVKAAMDCALSFT